MKPSPILFTRRRGQHGAVLFTGLVMLIIILLIAVAGVRITTLEARVTGNLAEQKRLQRAAESALRAGEWAVINNGKVLAQCAAGSTSTTPCYTAEATTYPANFTTSTVYAGLSGDTTLERKSRWYVRYIGKTCPQANPTDALRGTCANGGTYYYEVNAQAYADGNASATCTAQTLCLRSTVNIFSN